MSQPISDAEIDIIVSTTPIQSIAVGEVTNQPVAWDIGEVPNLISNGLPAAGTTGQQLAKKSNNDYDTQWVTPHEIPTGGAAGQVLGKASGTDYDTQWTVAGSPVPVIDECGDLSVWTQGAPGTVTVQTVADSAAGGKVFRAVGNLRPLCRTGGLVPFDPTALYRVRFRVRQTVNPTVGGSQIYAGLEGIAADGVTVVDNQGGTARAAAHFVAAYGITLTVAGGWQELVGYLQGTSASPANVANPSPSAPGKLHQNARYIRPTMFINHDAGNGTAEIDYVSLEIVTPTAVANSTEITLSGDGAGTPLSAALTGTVSGKSLSVPAGDVHAGAAGSATGYALIAHLLYNSVQADANFAALQLLGKLGAGLQLYIAGVHRGTLYLNEDNQLQTRDSANVTRPIPFATWCDRKGLTMPSAAVATLAFTLPTGRFTVLPAVTVGATHASNVLGPILSAVSQTSVTAGVRHYDGTATSNNTDISVMVMQMTPSAAPGRGIEPSPSNSEATCRNDGCVNAGLAIPIYVAEHTVGVYCGGCSQPITHVTTM